MTDDRGRIDDKLDRAIDAVADLVKEVLDGRGTARFAEAIRFCGVGQTLQASRRKTAEDYMEQEKRRLHGNVGGFNLVGGGHDVVAPYLVDPIPVPANGGGMPDQHQLVRDVLGAVGPYLQGLSKSQEAQTSNHELSELVSLRQLLEQLAAEDPDRPRLEARVSKLMKNVQERYSDAPELEPLPALPLVPTDVPRRHPARVCLGGGDEASRLRADCDGAGGDDAPPRARAEENPDARSVG